MIKTNLKGFTMRPDWPIALITITWCLGTACSVVKEEKKEKEVGASDTYATTPISGKIGGAAWTVASGRLLMGTDPDSPNQGNIEFYSQSFTNICETRKPDAADKKSFSMNVEAVVGEKDIGVLTGKSASFVDGSGDPVQLKAAGEGKHSIDIVTTTSVSGKVIAFYDADHSVNGTFTVPRCCSADRGVSYALCKDAAE